MIKSLIRFAKSQFAGRFSLLQYRSWSSPSSGPADVNGRNGRLGQLIRNIQSGKTFFRYNPDQTVDVTNMVDWKIEKTKDYIEILKSFTEATCFL
jgi:hypothetical protein